MFEFFKKRAQPTPDPQKLEVVMTYAGNDVFAEPIELKKLEEQFFLEDLDKSKFIRPEARDVALRYFRGEFDVIKTANKLTATEKKELGLNTRQTITRELVNILTDEGLRHPRPAGILSDLQIRASHRKSRHRDIRNLMAMPSIKEVRFRRIEGFSSCPWCNKNDGKKFLVSENPAAMVDANCTCEPYSHGYFEAVIPAALD